MLLRDLLGTAAGREQKTGRIREILDLHPELPFVLLGDSGEKDPEIYADIVRAYPGRILAVYIREVRLDPGDGRVEKVSGAWSRTSRSCWRPTATPYAARRRARPALRRLRATEPGASAMRLPAGCMSACEGAGIEPASSSVEPGLLRVQSMTTFFSVPALAQTRRRRDSSV